MDLGAFLMFGIRKTPSGVTGVSGIDPRRVDTVESESSEVLYPPYATPASLEYLQ